MKAVGRVILRFVRLSRSPNPEKPAESQPARNRYYMSRNRFRLLCAELFRKLGFYIKSVEYAGTSGVDMVALKQDTTYFIRCRQAGPREVDLTALSGFFSSLQASGCSRGIFVTTGFLTEQAQAFVAGKPIELINGRQLRDYFAELKIPVDTASTRTKLRLA
jgi:restriction system protein